jgi:hypothetical protein
MPERVRSTTTTVEPAMDEKELKPGDHIYVHRRRRLYKYKHHGIYCYGDLVIHLRWSKSKGTGVVEETTLSRFRRHKKCHVRHHHHCDPPDEVIRRARSHLGERFYNLVFSNCEHFATYCKTGKWRSRQVPGFVKTVLRPLYGVIRIARGW